MFFFYLFNVVYPNVWPAVCIVCIHQDYSEGGKCAQGKSENMTAESSTAIHPNPLQEGLTVITMATVYNITILQQKKGSLS